MNFVQKARCPRCAKSFEMNVQADVMSDEEFLELTKVPVADAPCDQCLHELMG